MAIGDFIETTKTDAINWSIGKFWQPRALILLFFIWVFVHDILSWFDIIDYPYMNFFFGNVDFLVHELGHYVFGIFGEFIGIAGGSIFQCLAPIFLIIGFYRQRDYFAISFGLCWLATNIFYVATYIADSRAQELPLLSPGNSEPIHDWNYLLSSMGLLNSDKMIATLIRAFGCGLMIAGLLFGAWIVWNMMTRKTKIQR